MGFWKKLFGLEKKVNAKFDPFAVDGDGDGKIQDGTIWERPAAMAVDLDKTIEKVEKLLKEVAPSQDLKLSEDLEKAAKAQARAKKAAMTRAVNKAKKEAELAAQITEASKKSDPKKK
jgi:hypothetical protein